MKESDIVLVHLIAIVFQSKRNHLVDMGGHTLVMKKT
jgi:hypothetical protein